MCTRPYPKPIDFISPLCAMHYNSRSWCTEKDTTCLRWMASRVFLIYAMSCWCCRADAIEARRVYYGFPFTQTHTHTHTHTCYYRQKSKRPITHTHSQAEARTQYHMIIDQPQPTRKQPLCAHRNEYACIGAPASKPSAFGAEVQ